LSTGLLNLCYVLSLMFPTWGALMAMIYMCWQHRYASLNLGQSNKA
jgi:hypothetical protein